MAVIETEFVYDYPLTPLRADQVRYVILHHAAARKATPEQIHDWHRAKGFGGFGYNEYIRKDGSVILGRGGFQGAHCKNYNAVSYGICAEGNYDEEQQMPQLQQEALRQRIAHAFERYPKIESVKRHSDFRATSCPGRYFPFETFEVVENPEERAARLSAIRLLSERGIIHDPKYWEMRTSKGGSVRGDYAAMLIRRMADYIRTFSKNNR